MLEIGKEQVSSLLSRLDDPSQLSQCQDEVRQMLKIKSELLWWAESGKCCSQPARNRLTSGIDILEDALNFLKEGNISQASSLLRDYMNQLEEEYG